LWVSPALWEMGLLQWKEFGGTLGRPQVEDRRQV